MLSILYRIPLFGWMLRDALEGREDAPVWFAANVAMLWGLSFIVFGYAGLIVPALAMVVVVMGLILAITVGN